MSNRHIWVTNLTSQGYVTPSVTWPSDSPYAISYTCSIATKSASPAVFQMLGTKHIWGHDLDLFGSFDVIGDVTIWFPGSNFLWVLYCHQVSIFSHFRDTRHQTYWGHDLDLSRSRDVIGYQMIRLAIPHFLYVLHCHQVCNSSRFRDTRP